MYNIKCLHKVLCELLNRWLHRDSFIVNGQVVSKFDLGLLNAYKLMYFDTNIDGNKDGKNFKGNK